MVAIELYSTRQRRIAKSGKADVYRYDVIPNPLRVQICHLCTDSEYVHAEVVQPALAFSHETIFRVAREGFLTAHKRYRQGQEKACIAAPAWPVVPKAILTIGTEAPGRLH